MRKKTLSCSVDTIFYFLPITSRSFLHTRQHISKTTVTVNLCDRPVLFGHTKDPLNSITKQQTTTFFLNFCILTDKTKHCVTAFPPSEPEFLKSSNYHSTAAEISECARVYCTAFAVLHTHMYVFAF